MSVLAGPDPRDRFSLPAGDDDWAHCTDGGIQGFRVAYSPDWGYAAVDPQVRAVVGDAVEVFERELGCTVERVEPGWPHPYEAFWAIVANESDLRGLRAMVERLGAADTTAHDPGVIPTAWAAGQIT